MNVITRTTTLGTLAALLAFTTTPAAEAYHGARGLYRLAGGVRAELDSFHALADQVLVSCRDLDDIHRRITDVERDLDRFERTLARPIRCHADIERLAVYADRVDREVVDLQRELERVIRRARWQQQAVPLPPPPRQAYRGHRGFAFSIGGGSSRISFGPRGYDRGFDRGPRHIVARPVPVVAAYHTPSRRELEALRCSAERVHELAHTLSDLLHQ